MAASNTCRAARRRGAEGEGASKEENRFPFQAQPIAAAASTSIVSISYAPDKREAQDREEA